MKSLFLILKCLIAILNISSVEATLSLKDFNDLITKELTADSMLKAAYEQSVSKYGCSDVSVPLHLASCHINATLVEKPTLVQYYRGLYGGIYRGPLFYLESGTQSLRFAAIDVYFRHQFLGDGSETLEIIKVEKNNPISLP